MRTRSRRQRRIINKRRKKAGKHPSLSGSAKCDAKRYHTVETYPYSGFKVIQRS